LCRSHTDAVNDDIADLVQAFAHAKAPIDRDWRCASGPNNLAHHHEPARIEPFSRYLQAFCPVVCEPRTISHHHAVFEEPLELLSLRLARNPPIFCTYGSISVRLSETAPLSAWMAGQGGPPICPKPMRSRRPVSISLPGS
jgi:hypothetical protein